MLRVGRKCVHLSCPTVSVHLLFICAHGSLEGCAGDMPAVAEISRQPEEMKAPRQAETAERPVTTPDSDWQERRAASQPVKVPVTDIERGWWGSIFAR